LSKVKCLICGRELDYINDKHLSTHNLTVAEYKERFNNPRMASLEKSVKNQYYNNPSWTDNMIELLKTVYPWESKEYIKSLFPKVGWSRICGVASELGLKRLRRECSGNFIWEYNDNKFNAHKDKNGYIVINNSELGVQNTRVHRYVWEQCNGDIPKNYDIHHIDGDVSNNDISNLELVLNVKHKDVERQLYLEIRLFLEEKQLLEEFEKWKDVRRNIDEDKKG
jgi:hypothetical protein